VATYTTRGLKISPTIAERQSRLGSAVTLLFNSGMPRGGAYTISDLPRDRLCRIACERCGRRGAYRRDTLPQRFGEAALGDVLIAVTACEQRGDYSRPCAARYVEPPGASAVKM